MSNQAIANEYSALECVLVNTDGTKHGAKIIGRLDLFATISPFNRDVPEIEYSWTAVKRVMDNDKTFYI